MNARDFISRVGKYVVAADTLVEATWKTPDGKTEITAEVIGVEIVHVAGKGGRLRIKLSAKIDWPEVVLQMARQSLAAARANLDRAINDLNLGK